MKGGKEKRIHKGRRRRRRRGVVQESQKSKEVRIFFKKNKNGIVDFFGN